jgi:hypothetical protein
MTTSSTPENPDLTRLLAAIQDTQRELRLLHLEMRVGFAEVRNDVQDVRRSVGTVIDSLADFRHEYATHTHPPEES